MKAKFVKEAIEFNRGDSPLRKLGLGGNTFDTIFPGAILKSKKWFGITKSGNFGGYHGSYHSWKPDSYALVTKVSDDGNKRTINFIKYFNFDRVQKARDQMLGIKDHDQNLDWYGGETRQFMYTTKLQFNNRFDIIEGGRPINEDFSRNDPNIYRKLGIGKKHWAKLERGDILIPKKEIKVDRGTFYPPSRLTGWKIWEEELILIKKISYIKVATKNGYAADGIRMEVYKAWDLDDALKQRKHLLDRSYEPTIDRDREIAGSAKQWENRFDIYEG